MSAQRQPAETDASGADVVNFPSDHLRDPVSIVIAQDGFPSGFRVESDGIHELTGKGQEETRHLCSLFLVKGYCCFAGGQKWGRVVEVFDRGGNCHQLVLDAAEVERCAYSSLERMCAHGLEIFDGSPKDILTLLRSWRPSEKFLRCDRLGWVSEEPRAFALSDGSVIGNAKVVLDGIPPIFLRAMAAKGDLQAWRDAVALPCSGNPLMIFALSHAFTGPLLEPLKMQGGGFHLRGTTSRGKSTIIAVAASVWGAPDFVHSWWTTDNGAEAMAAACNDTLLILDEMHQADRRKVGDIVYLLANGRGKLRMTKDGDLASFARWRVSVLSNGELSLQEHMASSGRKTTAGQDVRLVDIAADQRQYGAFDDLHGEESSKVFAERIEAATKSAHGIAGKEFLRLILENPGLLAKVEREMQDFHEDCIGSGGASIDGQIHRVLRRFALAAAAGELVSEAGITGWSPGEASRAAKELFEVWLRGRAGADALYDGMDRTAKYLAANAGRFLPRGDALDPADGWRDEEWFYFKPECWKDIHGERGDLAARQLREKGMLKTKDAHALKYAMRNGDKGRPLVYAISAKVLEEHLSGA